MSPSSQLLLYTVTSFGLIAAIWLVGRRAASLSEPCTGIWRATRWAPYVVGVLVWIAGAAAAQHAASRESAQLRRNLLAEAMTVAGTFSQAQIQALSVAPEDQDLAPLQRLQEQMTSYATARGLSSLYTLALREGDLILGPQAGQSAGAPHGSAPGTWYAQATAEDMRLFGDGTATVQGPWQNARGTWMSVRAPVADPSTGTVAAAIGIDVEASLWQGHLARAMRGPLGAAFALLTALTLAYGLGARSHGQRWVSARVVGGLGCALTMATAWVMYHAEETAVRAAFDNLAYAQAQTVSETFATMCNQVEGTVGVFAANNVVTREEFARYVEPLIAAGPADAWAWVPALPTATLRDPRRDEATQTVAPWTLDADGQRVATSTRSVRFPIDHIVTRQGDSGLVGYDLGADPDLAGIVQEVLTDRKTAAADLPSLPSPSDPESILIFRHAASATQEGILMAVLPIDRAVTQALRRARGVESHIAAGFFRLDAPDGPRPLGVLSEGHGAACWDAPHGRQIQTTVPIFAFGRSYALRIHPEPEWLAANRSLGWLVTGLVGLLLTATASALVVSEAGRRETLRREVERRTAQLYRQEAQYRALVEGTDAIAWEYSIADDRWAYVAPQVTRLLGYPPEEWQGATFWTDHLHPDDRDWVAGYIQDCTARGEAYTLEYRFRARDGRYVWLRDVASVEMAGEEPVARRGFLLDISEQRASEQALSGERILLRTVLDHLPVAVYVKDAQARKILANQLDVMQCGARDEVELYGKTDLEIFSASVAQSMYEDDLSVLDSGNPVLNRVERVEAVGGSERWLMTSKVPLRDQQGQVVGLVGVGRDITESRASSAALHRAYVQEQVRSAILELSLGDGSTKEILQAALDRVLSTQDIGLAPVGGVFLLEEDSQTLVLQASRGLPDSKHEKYASSGIEECPCLWALGRSEVLFSPPEACPVIATSCDEPLGGLYSVPLRLQGRCLGVLHVGVTLGQQRDERVEAFLVAVASVIAGVVARKAAEAEAQHLLDVGRQTRRALLSVVEDQKATAASLLALTARQDALLRSIPDMIIELDADFAIAWSSPAARAFFGDDIDGKNAMDAFRQVEEQSMVAALFRERQSAGSAEFWHRLPHGERRLVAWRWQPICDSSGRMMSVLASGRDVTEARQLETQMAQAQKMETIGQLAGGVAHDHNNMLQAILGYTDVAMELAPQDGELQHALEEIRKSAQRSAGLTRQLLAFSRRQTIAPREMDLNQHIGGMMDMLQRLIGVNLDLVWSPAEDLWPVKMDPAQVDQVLANLVVNARDAITDVGTITISTRNAALTKDESREHPGSGPGEYAVLAVRDTGVGMSPEVRAHLFEPFYTTKEAGQGTGLGLATVYGIVSQNGGWIDVDSEPGQGSTFQVYIPRATAAAQPAAAPQARAPEMTGGSETILIAEDEPTILNLAERVLARYGYSVLTAKSPQQAIEITREHGGPIDLLITDIVMPEMNGKDLYDQIVSMRPGVRAIFMSGYTANAITHQGVLQDGVLFLQKPFRAHELLARVRDALDRNGQSQG